MWIKVKNLNLILNVRYELWVRICPITWFAIQFYRQFSLETNSKILERIKLINTYRKSIARWIKQGNPTQWNLNVSLSIPVVVHSPSYCCSGLIKTNPPPPHWSYGIDLSSSMWIWRLLCFKRKLQFGYHLKGNEIPSATRYARDKNLLSLFSLKHRKLGKVNIIFRSTRRYSNDEKKNIRLLDKLDKQKHSKRCLCSDEAAGGSVALTVRQCKWVSWECENEAVQWPFP